MSDPRNIIYLVNTGFLNSYTSLIESGLSLRPFLTLTCIVKTFYFENLDGSSFFEKRIAIFFAPILPNIFIFRLVYTPILQYVSTYESYQVNFGVRYYRRIPSHVLIATQDGSGSLLQNIA